MKLTSALVLSFIATAQAATNRGGAGAGIGCRSCCGLACVVLINEYIFGGDACTYSCGKITSRGKSRKIPRVHAGQLRTYIYLSNDIEIDFQRTRLVPPSGYFPGQLCKLVLLTLILCRKGRQFEHGKSVRLWPSFIPRPSACQQQLPSTSTKRSCHVAILCYL
ncbi:uncharacterized protein F5891DRAFT_715449 [Suillus fuscotomentosus]|uniref:Secreted protein n=1 Tax=Suillus fuscotomentosus TaxID=1912939 RepID=A0AAD4DV96_9AGAM|nr:uncharacterized protein F5891DRAFT_715449 [Suillus fuscotomentosus]KAG1894564.1 hypothetical protein F5891DRAFT_715449 [Suillus fuscotomentosus]